MPQRFTNSPDSKWLFWGVFGVLIMRKEQSFCRWSFALRRGSQKILQRGDLAFFFLHPSCDQVHEDEWEAARFLLLNEIRLVDIGHRAHAIQKMKSQLAVTCLLIAMGICIQDQYLHRMNAKAESRRALCSKQICIPFGTDNMTDLQWEQFGQCIRESLSWGTVLLYRKGVGLILGLIAVWAVEQDSLTLRDLWGARSDWAYQHSVWVVSRWCGYNPVIYC